jgi:hypothetical protein
MKGRPKKPEDFQDVQNNNRKERPCLFCKKLFMSTGAGHRICKDCKNSRGEPNNCIQEVKFHGSRVLRVDWSKYDGN